MTQYSQNRVIGSTQIGEFEKLWPFLELASVDSPKLSAEEKYLVEKLITTFCCLNIDLYQVLKMSS